MRLESLVHLAGRPKDIALCATLLATGRLTPELIQERLRETQMNDRLRVLATKRLKQLIEMAGMQSS